MDAGRGARVRRCSALLVLSGLMVAAAAAPEGSTEPVVAADTGWYTSMHLEPGGLTVGDPVAANTIGSGELPVGASGQDESKRSYLRLDVPGGATSVVVELPLSESPGTNFGVPGSVLACSVTEPFFVSGGGDLDSAPEVDCTSAVVGEPNADLAAGETATAYRFDLSGLLPVWEQRGEAGVGLVADVSEPQAAQWQVTFEVDLFDQVGTAEVSGADPEPFDPPQTDDGPPAPTPPDSSQSEPFVPPSSGGGFSVETGSGPTLPPVTAEPPVTAPPSGGAETQPPVALAPVLASVNVVPWVLGLFAAILALGVAGRSLLPPRGPTALDRVLAP